MIKKSNIKIYKIRKITKYQKLKDQKSNVQKVKD